MLQNVFSHPVESAGSAAGSTAESAPKGHDNSYYGKCMVGGILACGITHPLVCPLDIVKCNMQANSAKFKTMKMSYQHLVAESGHS